MSLLAAAWPGAVAYADVEAAVRSALGRDAHADSRALAELVLGGYLAGMIELHAEPPPVAARPGATPAASPLARLQAARGEQVLTNLRHESLRLGDDPLVLAPLALLDGTRDRAALGRAFPAAATDEVEAALDRLANAGLLWA